MEVSGNQQTSEYFTFSQSHFLLHPRNKINMFSYGKISLVCLALAEAFLPFFFFAPEPEKKKKNPSSSCSIIHGIYFDKTI